MKLLHNAVILWGNEFHFLEIELIKYFLHTNIFFVPQVSCVLNILVYHFTRNVRIYHIFYVPFHFFLCLFSFSHFFVYNLFGSIHM
jgi:hypothetical protein